MTFEIFNPPELGEPRGWNNGMLAPAGGRLLFIAGQTARDGSGADLPESFVDQFEAALENLLAVVRHAGGEPEHVGRLTMYVVDMSELDALREVREEYLGDARPANTLVQVVRLARADLLLEVEAIAVVAE